MPIAKIQDNKLLGNKNLMTHTNSIAKKKDEKAKKEKLKQNLYNVAQQYYDKLNNQIEETSDKLKKYTEKYNKHIDSLKDIQKKYGKDISIFYKEEAEKNGKATQLERKEVVLQGEQLLLQQKGQADQEQLEQMQKRAQDLQQQEQDQEENPLVSSIYLEYLFKIEQRNIEREQRWRQEESQQEQSILQQEGKEFQEKQQKQQFDNQDKQRLEEDEITDYKNTKGDYEQEMDKIVDEELLELKNKIRQIIGLYETYLKQIDKCSVEDCEKMLKEFKQGSENIINGEEVIAKQYKVQNDTDISEELLFKSKNTEDKNNNDAMKINFGNSGIKNNLTLKNIRDRNAQIQR